MTQAQWVASVPPQGTLTVAMVPALLEQALTDGDAQNALNAAAGTNINNANLSARTSLWYLIPFFTVAAVNAGGNVLSTPARNQVVNAGSGYYQASGAP